MRKILVLAVVLLTLSLSTAYAEEIKSVVGKVIEGEFPVKVNGEILENKAIVVNGTSYLPVREFGEKLGFEVKFDADMGITLEKQEEPASIKDPDPINPIAPKRTKEDIEKELNEVEQQISRLTSDIEKEKIRHELLGGGSYVEIYQESLKGLEARKAELLKELESAP